MQENEMYRYLNGQLEKIYSVLKRHQIIGEKIEEINHILLRQIRVQEQTEKKLKILEVFQTENYYRNQRVLKGLDNLDILQLRLLSLEKIHQQTAVQIQKYRQKYSFNTKITNQRLSENVVHSEDNFTMQKEEKQKQNEENNMVRNRISKMSEISEQFFQKETMFKLKKQLQLYINEKIKIIQTNNQTSLFSQHVANQNMVSLEQICRKINSDPRKQSKHDRLPRQVICKNKIDSYYTKLSSKTEKGEHMWKKQKSEKKMKKKSTSLKKERQKTISHEQLTKRILG